MSVEIKTEIVSLSLLICCILLFRICLLAMIEHESHTDLYIQIRYIVYCIYVCMPLLASSLAIIRGPEPGKINTPT